MMERLQIDRQRELRLEFRIVHHADRCGDIRRLRLGELVKLQLFRKRLHPKTAYLDIFPHSEIGKVLDDRNDLLGNRLLLFRLRFCVQHDSARSVDKRYGVVFFLQHFILREIARAAPCGLAERKVLVISDLQIESAGLLQFGGFGAFQHFHTVAAILYLQTDPEFRVAPDLVVDHAARLLRCEDQVNAEASADTRRTDQLVHEFRLLFFQLCKLVGNDKQMRQRFLYLPHAIQLLVVIDVHGTFVCLALRLFENRLSSLQFAVDRHERTLDRRAVKVRDRSDDVRKMNAP